MQHEFGRSDSMNPWFAKSVVLAASVLLIAIRAPHGHRSRTVKTAKNCKGRLEVALLIVAWLGFFTPLVWVVSPAFVFTFADYTLYLGPYVAGIVFYAVGLWLFRRSHVDLGTNWSVTLEVREDHRLITHGVYRYVRHPMYTALFLYSIAQLLVVPNWFVGPSQLVAFGILFALRLGAEERMMLNEFGDEYAAYMARTKRIIPGIW